MTTKPDEKTSLLANPMDKMINDDHVKHLRHSYDSGSHGKFTMSFDNDHEVLIDYEPLKFSTFRVCCAMKGTVFNSYVLFVEQLIITAMFVAAALPVYIYFGKEMASNRHGDISIRKFIDTQEGKMRAFAMIMTGLASMLLSFYTSIAVGRWWTIRTAGVGGIKAATVELCMFISTYVTQEQEVLSAIRRYGRASLFLVFLWRRERLGDLREMLVSREILTNTEVDQLLKWNHNLHETIWGWQTGIVTMLHKEGKIHSDQLYSMLLDRCCDGRQAVQLVHTHLAVRVPMQYVHLLGYLVKLHNTVLAIIMGLLFGAAVRNFEIVICIQLFGRTLILPVLFNAILLINAELSDPFDGGSTDFPGSLYEKTLDKDCEGVVAARQNYPDWLQTRAGIGKV